MHKYQKIRLPLWRRNLRKVERYEIADGRTYNCPVEALEAEILSAICAAVPCSTHVGENILQKWDTIHTLVTEFQKNRDAVYATLDKPMPHF